MPLITSAWHVSSWQTRSKFVATVSVVTGSRAKEGRGVGVGLAEAPASSDGGGALSDGGMETSTDGPAVTSRPGRA
jgi:hypothetical protein